MARMLLIITIAKNNVDQSEASCESDAGGFEDPELRTQPLEASCQVREVCKKKFFFRR